MSGNKAGRLATISLQLFVCYYMLSFSPFQATNAIGVLCEVEELQEVVKQLFPRVLATLLLRLGVSSTIEPPESKKAPSCIRWGCYDLCGRNSSHIPQNFYMIL